MLFGEELGRTFAGTQWGRGAVSTAEWTGRRQESLYRVKDVEMSAVAAALADRGIAMGAAVPRTGRLLEFTAPGVSALETTAALDAVRVLHATFISLVPDPRLRAGPAA